MDSKEIRAGAFVFLDAAKTLEVVGKAGLSQLDEEFGNNFLGRMYIPCIVYKAFGCELLLKSLIVSEGKEYNRIHALNELYDILDSKEKEAIKEEIKKKNNYGGESKYNDKAFDNDLAEISNTFVDWRYFYEKKVSVNILFLDAFIDVLKKMVS